MTRLKRNINLNIPDAPHIKYPCVGIAHWPSGPIALCRSHLLWLLHIGEVMGTHVVVTKLTHEQDCINCVIANKTKNV